MELEPLVDVNGLSEPVVGSVYEHDLWHKLGYAYDTLCDRHCDDPDMMKEAQRRQRIVQMALAGRIPEDAITFAPPPITDQDRVDVLTEVNNAIFDKQWSTRPSFNAPVKVYSHVLNRMVEFTIHSDYVAELQRWVLMNYLKFTPIKESP